MRFSKLHLLAICAGAALLAAGCGGGSGDSPASPGGGEPAASVLTGTAATGAALANANVSVTNGAGGSPCVEAAITTTALGSYTCTLKSGEAAPFFVVVIDPTGNTPPLVSISTTTPAAGASLVLNATPLTTAIVAQLADDGDPLSVVNARSVDAAELKAVTANVVAQLTPVLTSIGVPSGYDPFTTSITAATASTAGNTADLVLDVVKVVTDPATGKLALSTLDDPTPVALATATGTPTQLAAPDASVATLSSALQVTATSFNACFALPTDQRVTSKNTTLPQAEGGPEADGLATACHGMVSDSANAAGIDFLHNGYYFGQFAYGLLTSDTMTGAKFSVPELMAFYPKSATAPANAPESYDRAVVNLRYLDANGDPGNLITVASRIPGSSTSTHPTEWWLTGNQQAVDTAVRLNIRRFEQLNPSNTGRFSTYQTGMQFNINFKGPGSMRSGEPLNWARVTGPGLPAGGVVYGVSTGAQNTMDLWNKTGTIGGGSACNNGGATVNCPNLWFARTAGLSGTAATTLASNPSGGVNTLIWAQPGDTFDPSKVVKGARYKIELFYGSNTGTADLVVFKTLLSDLVQAGLGAQLPWNTPGTKTMAALDPNGGLTGAQTALEVDWVQNPSAQQIGGAQAVVNAATGSFGPTRSVPRGASSVVLNNQTVPAFASGTTRTLLFGYRMTDSSSKTAVYSWN